MAEPSAAPAEADSRLVGFNASIEALNELELSTEGVDLFSGIASVDGRTVHVGATAAWNTLPTVGKQSYLDALLDYWVAAQGGQGPAVVRIVDPSGRVLVEKSAPWETARAAQLRAPGSEAPFRGQPRSATRRGRLRDLGPP
jgi:hypothetical protein